MVFDAKQAFLHDDALTETYVKPPHLPDTERSWMLKKSKYGTLLAAEGWQHLLGQKVGADIGLLCSSNCPCAFVHASRDLDVVVHGDDFTVVGCGDDLDWLSQELNERFELAQKARWGPGYDTGSTMLHRSVMYNDSGLTREADPRHVELAVAELKAARPQTSQGGAKPSTPLDHMELESDGQKLTTACQQDWHIWQETDLTSHSPPRNAAVQLGKQSVLTSHV